MEQELIEAIASRNLHRVQELLAAGANPNARQGDRTAFELVPHGADEIKCALIEAGAEDPSLTHSLVWVTMMGRVETVRVLIEKGADINVLTYCGTPIQVAASRGYGEIAELLIAAGADVDAGSSISTPLLDAIEKRHFDIALKLIAAGADPKPKSEFGGVPPIAMAAAQGSAEVIRALLAAGAEVDTFVPNITINRFAIMQQAAAGLKTAFEAIEVVGSALDALDAVETGELPAADLTEAMSALGKAEQSSASLKSTKPENAVDTTPAILAARCGHAAALAELLEAGANPHRKDGEGLSAYDWAVRNEHTQVLEVLRRFGVDGPRFSPDECLLNAAEQGDVAAVRQWLSRGANANVPDRRRKTKNSTPLMLAVAGGHLEVVQALLLLGANPNLSDAGEEPIQIPRTLIEEFGAETIVSMGYRLGRTPLMLAAKEGNLAIARTLLEGHAEVNAKDALGYTALHLACEQQHLDIVRELIDTGAEVNCKNFQNETVLFRPAQKCHLQLIKLLLEGDVDVNAISKSGETALALAAGATQWIEVKDTDEQLGNREYRDDGIRERRPMPEQQVLETIKILLKAGADPNLPKCSITALSAAASQGYLRVMQHLLDVGARVDLRTNDGETAFGIAELYGQRAALELLQQHAGDFNWQSRWQQDDSTDDEDYGNDERWGAELPRPDFSAAAQNPKFQEAVANLAQICGSTPVLVYDIPGWFEVHVNSKRRREIKTFDLQRQFLERGCFVYEPKYSKEEPEKLCILPTTDKYDAIALHQTNGCNCGIGPGYVVEWLKQLEAKQPFVLTCIEHDTLAGHFLTPIQDPQELAERMYDFCPDIVSQGCGSVEALAQSLQTSSKLFFWWD
ncbi:MAG TPA: hypothetical protein DDW76_02080 [Cyanobacteria bacterium UBA11369]|nr:hypothetical protein [Cyanobacteria bacterium UBA11371]HBE32582.1 hypothetical protein [Cyanobacteria bacterium UBA11368]HBE47617.1 hypothetical protein [Cyanobacteria bacterium UBA11369]